MRRLIFNMLILFALTVSNAAWAASTPVKITWPTQINVSLGFELEIARDPGFADVALTAPVRDQSFRWEAEEQGVYHWRLVRANPEGGERNTFISGSFVAVQPALSNGEPIRMTWGAVDGADRYQLRVFEGGARERLMVTSGTIFLVPRLESPLMIEMVPYAGDRRLARDFRLNETLSLEGKYIEPPPAPVPAKPPVPDDPPPAEKPAAPEPAAATETEELVETRPLDQPLEEEKKPETEESALEEEPQPVAAEATPAAVAEEPETPAEEETAEPTSSGSYFRPTHAVHGFLLGVDERLHAQKLEIDIESHEQEVGYGASVQVASPTGIVLSARVDYFEHRANFETEIVSSEDESTTSAYEILQARIYGDLAMGYDVMAWFDLPQHMLVPAVAGAAIQVPLLPTEYSGAPGTAPGLSSENYYLFGGGMTYGYFVGKFGTYLSAGVLTDMDDVARVAYQRLVVDYFPVQPLSVQLGAYARSTQVTTCAEDAAVCLREGDVRTSSRETGIQIGFGYTL